MNSRERILVVGLGSLLGAWIVWSTIRSRIIEPLNLRDEQIAALESDLASKQRTVARGERAAKQIEEWRSIALPGDVSLAQTLYLDQLRRTLERAGIERPTIRTARPVKRGDDYTRIPVGVDAKCRLNDLTAFLRQFEDAPLLHQIRRLRVQPIVKDGKIESFDCSIAIEALSMPDALAEDRLPTREDSPSAIERKPTRDQDDFLLFVSKNPFQPTEIVDRSTRREGSAASAAQKDERDDYYLVAAVTVDGASEIWLRNRADSSRKVVPEGGMIEVGGFQAKVVKISPDSILLEVDEKIGSIAIGRNLASWKPAEDAAPSETPQSSTDE